MAANSDALNSVRATDPTEWLAPSPALSQNSRSALKNLFSTLLPFTPKSPFDQLLTDGFDAEQIWQQIDIQSQPLISSLRRQLHRYEKHPDDIKTLKLVVDGEEKVLEAEMDDLDESDEELEELEKSGGEEDEDEEENEEEDEEEENEEEEEEKEGEEGDNPIEDKFFKLKDLSKFVDDVEAEEYKDDDDDDDDDEEKEDEDEDEDDLDLMNLEDDGEGGDVRYEDFWGKQTLSTHEKEQQKLKAKIQQLEKKNLEPKTWTMQGEITAEKRPKNSALEADLDFEHNVRPAPVITEEVTMAIEDMIKKRIEEECFDDVRRAPTLPSKAPREYKEMDENKNKEGLAKVYEEEFVKTTNTGSAPLPVKDKQKEEAEALFKKLCLKLDSLSHFHFTPKPVVEEMSMQHNVPALVMEEVAPVAVSEAAMVAPEEVFSGKGDIKDEAELTQAERKRRRANKKRKFKAVTAEKMAKKPRESNKDAIEAM